MVFGEVLAGAAAGAHQLWNYNRDNFMFDREMRQKTEYQILAWRSKQAALWREDVRDIIGLTEKKMDTYLVVTVLQLTMCLGMFTEGRLEPGTPPWLLHLYMLTLGATFMYLLMSVWLAMHASVVAACSSVRILTQFVRLPVPSWEQLESMRTYAQQWERVEANKMLRVPFLPPAGARRGARRETQSQSPARDALSRSGSRASFSPFKREQTDPAASAPLAPAAASEQIAAASSPDAVAAASDACADQRTVDPWGTELHGDARDIQELRSSPATLRRHVGLARRAAAQYQCYDAFARVSMAFGTNQMLNALAYYVLGYVAVQDGAPLAAWCIVFMMICIAAGMVQLDFSLSASQMALAHVLVVIGPACSSAATYLWATHGTEYEDTILMLLPAAYASHGLWLYFALLACGMELQPNGAVLPVNFRAVLYLDVFGWYKKPGRQSVCEPDGYSELPQSPKRSSRVPAKQPDDALSNVASSPSKSPASKIAGERSAATSSYSPPARSRSPLRFFPEERDGELDEELGYNRSSQLALPSAQPEDSSPQHVRLVAEALSPDRQGAAARPPSADDEAHKLRLGLDAGAFNGPSGEVVSEHPDMFRPTSFAPVGDEDTDVVTGHHLEHPGQVPARIFRFATMVLILLWAAGLLWPLGGGPVRDLMTQPLAPQLVVEEIEASDVPADSSTERALTNTWSGQDALADAVALPADSDEIPMLPEGELIEVNWPSHSGFVPRSLSSDTTGTQLVVADDLGVYTGKIVSRARLGESEKDFRRRLRSHGKAASDGELRGLSVSFSRAPACAPLEGKEVEDLGVVCTHGTRSECRVVVLHTHGQRLSECPIPHLGRGREGSGSALAASAGNATAEKTMDETVSWVISDEWLRSGHDGEEFVESLAVNSKCLRAGLARADEGNAFRPDELGCVIVGTSRGRVVELRGALTGEPRLVPERAIQQDKKAVRHGALHVLPSGKAMALRRSAGVVEVWDAESGASEGEWQLPRGVHWLALCGGGDSLFVLGVRSRTNVELRRFPVPASLLHDEGVEKEKSAAATRAAIEQEM